MMQFLAAWIKNGSFRHYGGGLRLHHGEGSGCAEFAIHFLTLLKGAYACLPAWDRAVWIPKAFLGSEHKKISYFTLFLKGKNWATGPEDGVRYRVPDPELVAAWVLQRSSPWSSAESAISGPAQTVILAGYPTETNEMIAEQWRKITVISSAN